MAAPLDTQDMFAATGSLPEQLVRAAEAARAVDELPDPRRIENVVVLGMGGSGLAGDVLAAVAAPLVPVPVVVVKGYELPGFVGEASLVFALSFSGDTEEILEAASRAAVEGARMVVVSGAGELARLGASWGAPLVAVPDALPQPRSALGALAAPPLVVLERMGLLPGAGEWLAGAADHLTARRDQLALEGNEAASLAKQIGRTIPLVYGGGPIGAVAAQRWKTQLNENAKVPAFWNAQPELSHNEVSGWGQHGDLTRQAFTLVLLRHDFEHPQVMRRFEVVTELVEEVVGSVLEVRAEGDEPLVQLLDLVLVGDLCSLHLAAQEGVDPGPVPAIEDLKRRLRD